MLSKSSLKAIGKKVTQAVKELQAKGLDVAEYNIQNVVDDMEAVRAALGYEKINITGGSYGLLLEVPGEDQQGHYDRGRLSI